MKLIVTRVGNDIPTVSPDYREFAVEVRIVDVWCEEEAALRAWVSATFGRARDFPDYWVEGDGKGSLTFTTRLPARSEAELRALLSSIRPFDSDVETA